MVRKRGIEAERASGEQETVRGLFAAERSEPRKMAKDGRCEATVKFPSPAPI